MHPKDRSTLIIIKIITIDADLWNHGSAFPCFSKVVWNKRTWITFMMPSAIQDSISLTVNFVHFWSEPGRPPGPPRCDPTKSNDSIRLLIVLRSHTICRCWRVFVAFQSGQLGKTLWEMMAGKFLSRPPLSAWLPELWHNFD